jgi:hypothetical protein
LPQLAKFKKNISGATDDKFSLNEYRNSNLIREAKLNANRKQVESQLIKKMNEKNELICSVCHLQKKIDEIDLEMLTSKNNTKMSMQKRSSCIVVPKARRQSKKDVDYQFEFDSLLQVNYKIYFIF